MTTQQRSQPKLFPISKHGKIGDPLPKGKSELEEDFAKQLEWDDLPEAQREFHFAKAIGRQWRFDFAWPEHRIAIEMEGGIFVAGRHNRPISMEKDMEKYNAAVMLGWKLGRFSKRMIKSGEAVAWLKEMLKSQA